MCYKRYFLVAFDCRYEAVCHEKKERFMGEIFRPFRIYSLQNETYIIFTYFIFLKNIKI
jgi:hypothetical protein